MLPARAMGKPVRDGHVSVRSRFRGALVVGFISSGTSGCDDPNKMFEGRWESVAVIEGSRFLSGRPELSIGHYGRELTGVARFLDRNGLATDDCACAFIEQQRIELEFERFVAVTERCNGEVWIWELERVVDVDDLVFLEGTVVPAEGGEATSVSLRLADEFVSEERRECAR